MKVVQEPGVEQNSIQYEYPLYCLSDAGRFKPIKVEVVVDGNPITMELDTGVAVCAKLGYDKTRMCLPLQSRLQ